MRRLISSGSPFETDIGYARAVVDGDWVFVSGTTGFDYETMTISEDVAEQAEQALRNIGVALGEAGGSFSDVVRVRYILPKAEDFPACWPALRRYFGETRPAATMIAAGLADPRMKIEIEVTARLRTVPGRGAAHDGSRQDMDRRTLMKTAALASVSPMIATQALASGAPPAAVADTIAAFGTLPPLVSCYVAYTGPKGAWQSGYNEHSVQFVGSAVKTFILAQVLKDAEDGKLSENDQWTIDDSVRSLSSPVFLNLTGTTAARSVLEAMIAHSDNTATDVAIAKAGPAAVRALIAKAGLTETRIADSTRRMFSYLAGAAPGVDLTWAELVKAQSGWAPGKPRPALNAQETMASSAVEMVRWYQQALAGDFFSKPETLAEFKRIQAMADAIPAIMPPTILGFGKGGSIDWEGFHCIAVAGQMVSGAAAVTFCFALNWTGTNDTIIPRAITAVKGVLAAAAEAFSR